jgi:hypothetical protein
VLAVESAALLSAVDSALEAVDAVDAVDAAMDAAVDAAVDAVPEELPHAASESVIADASKTDITFFAFIIPSFYLPLPGNKFY